MPMLNQVDYYRDEEVRKRIAEYCGGVPSKPGEFSSYYLVGYGEAYTWEGKQAFMSSSNEDFDAILGKGLDMFRSVWDRDSTLCVLDVEYFNHDYGGEIYLHQREAFSRLEGMYNIIKSIYDAYGIEYVTIMTGQGYHFSARIAKTSPLHKEIEKIGNVAPTMAGKYQNIPPGSRRKYKVDLDMGAAYDGVGRLLEFLTHEIIRRAGSESDLPFVVSDIAVGRGRKGREGISLDLTMYSDPLYMRDIRVPFSTHQKHKVMRYKVGDWIANKIPVQVTVPRRVRTTDGKIMEKDLDELFEMRRHFRNSAEYAARCDLRIPEASKGFEKVLADYLRSDLYKFHQHFDSVEHDDWTNWGNTYDRLDKSWYPPCVTIPIENPNPGLLKPTNLQTLCRCMLARGWHPKHIGGFIRSKYERDFGWEENWNKYDAASRGNWWSRVYCGLLATGADQEQDLNCVSHQEKEFCPSPWCGYNLESYKLEKK
jgi:hypothetical protein